MTEINNRIEEVKKILEHYFSEELGEGASDDIAEEICQLFPQPLDDKELREKIARMLYFGFEEFEVGSVAEVTWREAPQARRDTYLKDADQILALLQPKIEEARAQAIELYVEQVLPLLLESAIERGRKSIQALYENMGCVPEEDNCWYRFWQALKRGG